jgi:hypothetical protein
VRSKIRNMRSVERRRWRTARWARRGTGHGRVRRNWYRILMSFGDGLHLAWDRVCHSESLGRRENWQLCLVPPAWLACMHGVDSVLIGRA